MTISNKAEVEIKYCMFIDKMAIPKCNNIYNTVGRKIKEKRFIKMFKPDLNENNSNNITTS